MRRVYWDTMLFIYLSEGGPAMDRIWSVRKSMQERGDKLCTAMLTLGEIMVRPYRLGNLAAVEKLRRLVRPPEIEIIHFDEETADHFARIRAVCRVAPADAIHLASAARARANLFLTNDRALCRLHVPGIDFIAPLDTELF